MVGQVTGPPDSTVETSTTPDVPSVQTPVVESRARWSSFGGDLQHSRSNPHETTLDRTNVDELSAAIDIDAPGVTATPAVYEGILYWSDWGGTVHATDPSTQSDIWSKDRGAEGGGYTGSPAVTQRMVYVANRNGLLSAFDRTSGDVVWEEVLDAGVHTHIWSSPMVAEQDNVLVVGVGGLGTRDNGIALPDGDIIFPKAVASHCEGDSSLSPAADKSCSRRARNPIVYPIAP